MRMETVTGPDRNGKVHYINREVVKVYHVPLWLDDEWSCSLLGCNWEVPRGMTPDVAALNHYGKPAWAWSDTLEFARDAG